MGRKAKGSVVYDKTTGHWKARITCADGSRPWVDLGPGPDTPQARGKAKKKAVRLTEDVRAKGIVAEPSRRTPAAGKRSVNRAADNDAWVKRWIHEKKLRGQTSASDSEDHIREHIEPAIGKKHIQYWKEEDLQELSLALDRKVQAGQIAWKTAVNIWGTATKMCKDAKSSKVECLRVRRDNPAADVCGPDRGVERAKQYLYPSEFLDFVRCPDIPLVWRRRVTLCVYLYCRAGELRELEWTDIDLRHQTAHIHRATDRTDGGTKAPKNRCARRFALEPNLIPLLEVMRDEAGGAGRIIDVPAGHLARAFRTWLGKSGVDRAELLSSTETTRNITFHDTRATSCTWAAVRGDDPIRIMSRAGHENINTTMIYVREAETIAAGFGDPFPELPECLLGSAVEKPARRECSTLDAPAMAMAPVVPIRTTGGFASCTP